MSSEWPLRSLKDVADLLTGFPFKSKDYSNDENGYKLLRGDNIVQGCFRWEDVKRWPKSLLIDKDVKYFLKEGDVILAMDRPWIEAGLKFAQISSIDMPCLLVQRVACLRANETLDQDFLRYLISSYSFVEYVKQVQTGTAVPHISGKQILDFEFNLPPKIVQKSTSKILKSLDNKIQLNNQINQTLEQMAQAIFKSWFVDFDPVKAKIAALEAGGSEDDALLAAMQAIAGSALFATDAADADAQTQLARLQTEHPEQYATLRATAELFPSAMQESELGEIPEGWEVTDFGAVSVCFDKHRIPLSKAQRDKRKGHIPYYGATSVMDYVDEHIFDDIFLLLGEDGSVLQKDDTPFIQYIWGKAWVNNHAHVLQGKGNVSTEQILLFMKNQNIAPYVTGAVQLKLNQKNMNSIPFIKATDEVCIAFNLLLKPMFADLRNREDESRKLSSLRDTLLPKLLSGELSVSAAADQITKAKEAVNVQS